MGTLSTAVDPWVLTWYVARASGIVAWALLALSVIVGLVQSTRVTTGKPGPAWLRSFHGNAGAMALAFAGIHMVALLLDRTIEFSLLDLVVPFTADWRPGAVAWGIAGFYVLLAVAVTAWLRSRLPRGVWLKIHRIAAAGYVLSTIHLLAAGTDVTSPALMWTVLASILTIGALLLTRIWLARVSRTPQSQRVKTAVPRSAR